MYNLNDAAQVPLYIVEYLEAWNLQDNYRTIQNTFSTKDLSGLGIISFHWLFQKATAENLEKLKA